MNQIGVVLHGKKFFARCLVYFHERARVCPREGVGWVRVGSQRARCATYPVTSANVSAYCRGDMYSLHTAMSFPSHSEGFVNAPKAYEFGGDDKVMLAAHRELLTKAPMSRGDTLGIRASVGNGNFIRQPPVRGFRLSISNRNTLP